jgi:sugar phosphate isomerase/epimerase
MKIGYPNHPRRNITEELCWIRENGFEFVDLFLEPEAGVLDKIDPDAIRRELDGNGLSAVGHLACYLPIGSAMPELRKCAVDIASKYLKLFGRIGVEGATVHSNWPSMSLFSPEEGVELQIESLKQIVRAASSNDVRVLYEPVDKKQDSNENLERILNAVPQLGCHLDLGHCNLHGKQPEDMIRRFGDRLCHVHLHDNFGKADMHLPPGTGNIDWNAVFEAFRDVGYNGTVTLEIFSGDRDYVLLARKKIEKLRSAFLLRE